MPNLVGNLLSLLVLSQEQMKSVFNHLLGFLCLADLAFIVPNLVFSILIIFDNSTHEFYYVLDCIGHVGLASSIFLITSITLERHHVSRDVLS